MSGFNKDAQWDTRNIYTWASDYSDADGLTLTKLRPVVELEQTGLLNGEPWARLWHNDILFNISQHLKWLAGNAVVEKSGGVDNEITQVENHEPVGTIKYINQTVRNTWFASLPNNTTTPEGRLRAKLGNGTFTAAIASELWGGTWTLEAETANIWTCTKTALENYEG